MARLASGGLKSHALRHSYVTWLVDDGVPVNVVQRVLGHERSSTTLDLYTRRTDGEIGFSMLSGTMAVKMEEFRRTPAADRDASFLLPLGSVRE
ncbi:tyrosine-type recombinase/integrase [Saccharopolyspora sp. NPDC049357]|uniref:tyrosine-type recombinase/integrase n=1 Tax=Saccharopolyspora sp. NPDC049357 TaxID=3154507 RepID=UPI003435FBB0